MKNKQYKKFNSCIDCGKSIVSHYALRCRVCYFKRYQTDEEFAQHRKLAISKGMKGVNTWQKGREATQETKDKMRKVRKNRSYEEIYGKEKALEIRRKMSFVKGGNGDLKGRKYPDIWNDNLREKIRLNDNKRCVLCNQRGLLDVHHLDLNKKNCGEKNLLTLCRSCHTIIHNIQRRYLKYEISYSTTLGKKVLKKRERLIQNELIVLN